MKLVDDEESEFGSAGGGLTWPRWTKYCAAPADGDQVSVGVVVNVELSAGPRLLNAPAVAHDDVVVNVWQLENCAGQFVFERRAPTRHSYAVFGCNAVVICALLVFVVLMDAAVQPWPARPR